MGWRDWGAGGIHSDTEVMVISCGDAVLGRRNDKFRGFHRTVDPTHSRVILEPLGELPVNPTGRVEFVTTSGQFSFTKGETCVKPTDLVSMTR